MRTGRAAFDYFDYFVGMIESLPLHEVKARFSQIVRRVRERGDVVLVTYHGEPVAEIRPVSASAGKSLAARLKALEEQGALQRSSDARPALKRTARKPGALRRFNTDRNR
ncbi:MAG: type II toxin-antitoxin system Phd/YefM family antitoxin [Longimicrobiales bacterium]